MKKIICFLLSAVLLVSLAACTSAPNRSENQVEGNPSITKSDSSATATEQKEEPVEESSTEEPVEKQRIRLSIRVKSQQITYRILPLQR